MVRRPGAAAFARRVGGARGPRLVLPVRLAAAAIVVLGAASARAARVEPLEWTARLEAIGASELFPDDSLAGPDRGLRSTLDVSRSLRVGSVVKLGFDAQAGGELYRRFEEARYGWLGGSVSARRGGTQLVVDGEWTPRRVKFPAQPEDAAFRRLEGHVGIRQSLPLRLRLRLEGRYTHDDYVAAWDARDERTPDLFGQLSWSPSAALTFRAEAEGEHAGAAAGRYTHDDHVGGGSVSWRGATWRVDGGVHSGVRQYADALPRESNYRRRDQWITTTASVGRRLASGVTLVLGGAVTDQTSSRPDRAYNVQSFRLGLEWSPAGE